MNKKGTRIVAKDVDAYLAALPVAQRRVLAQLRKTIRAAAPQAEEVISYQIPGYKFHGPVVYFAAFKNHCSLFGIKRSNIAKFKKELAPFKIVETTIHFTPEKPLPASLVKKFVQLRIAENLARTSKKHA